jgi:type III pantothenate kinase
LDLPTDTSRIAVASVVPWANAPLQNALNRSLPGVPIHVLSARDALPIQIAFRTPDTLGADRIAAALGAHARYPDARALVVVDAGTAVTYEVLVGTRYLGGAIAPGPALQLESLARGTAQLPHVDLTGTPDLIGTDTASSLASGAWWGFVASVDGMVHPAGRARAARGARA